MTRNNHYRVALICGVTLFFAGCNKQDDSKANYQTAINNYYKAHPALPLAGHKEVSCASRDLGRRQDRRL